MRATCVFTVASPTTSSLAMSAFERPATSRSTSSSRGVSSASAAGLALGGGLRGVALDQPASDRGGEEGVACRDDTHRLAQLRGARVFEQEAAGAGAERLVDVVVEVEGSQDQDPR